jgi:hypothetical protein
MSDTDVGEPIPPLTAHVCPAAIQSRSNASQAVSVSLPTWETCVAYEEGKEWVVCRMKTGYPRSVTSEASLIADRSAFSSTAPSLDLPMRF